MQTTTETAAADVARALSPGQAVQALAAKFVQRAEVLGLKGKNRDDAALHFFCGAAAVAGLLGEKGLEQNIGVAAYFTVAVRGYLGVKELAAKVSGS